MSVAVGPFGMPEEFKPRFDGTINLGHILSLSAVLITVIGGYYSMSTRLSSAESQLSRIATVLEITIRQDEQIKTINYRLDRMERLDRQDRQDRQDPNAKSR